MLGSDRAANSPPCLAKPAPGEEGAVSPVYLGPRISSSTHVLLTTVAFWSVCSFPKMLFPNSGC